MSYTFSQLMGIWEQAGGSKVYAAMAAAVAMAESGGNPNAANYNGNGSVDRGLWQINSTHGAQSTFDVMANARAAIAISNNGSSWRPWCTAYSDGLCGTQGGSYLGSGSPAMKALANAGQQAPSQVNVPGGVQSPSTLAELVSANGPNIGSSDYIPQGAYVQNASSWFTWLEPWHWWSEAWKAGNSFGTQVEGQANKTLGDVSNMIANGIASGLEGILAPIGRILMNALFVIGGAGIMALGLWWSYKEVSNPPTGQMMAGSSNPPAPVQSSQQPKQAESNHSAQSDYAARHAKKYAGRHAKAAELEAVAK